MSENYREESRKEWRRNNSPATADDIKLGCLQRIADATEQMAKNYTAMQDQLERYMALLRAEVTLRKSLQRMNRSLRGVITRQKKRAECAQNSAAAADQRQRRQRKDRKPRLVEK